jgi:hypothetical protein
MSNTRSYSQEVCTWAFLGRTELICPNLVCMYVYVYVYVCVCVYVCHHAQKIAKQFFSMRSTQFPFNKYNIIQKIYIYINLLGPKTLRLLYQVWIQNTKGDEWLE